MEWEECVENPELVSILRSNGFLNPTPIQSASLKHTLKYVKDVILSAQTGSGKTLCFGIPIVNAAIPGNGMQALVITPTRELALQIQEHIQAINYKKLNILCLIGGLSSQKQERLFKRNPEVLIATPGRLWEFINDIQNDTARTVANVKVLVIDEADRMVEMGHFKELHSILNYIYNPTSVPKDIIETAEKAEKTEKAGKAKVQDINFGYELMIDPSEFSLNFSSFKDMLRQGEVEPIPIVKQTAEKVKRQTILVSATLTMQEEGRLTHKRKIKMKEKGLSDNRLEHLMSRIKFKGKPEIIDLTQNKISPEQLKEAKILCQDDEKDAFLLYFLKEHKAEPTIVFTNSISCTRRVVAILKELKISAFCLDGKMQQRQRLKRVEQFKKSSGVLVATDVAGRGIDLPTVQNVVMYQVPQTTESYVHKSGRTARMHKKGFCLTLVGEKDTHVMRKIQWVLGREIPAYDVFYQKFQQCIDAVKMATEIATTEFRKKKERVEDSWVKRSADDAGVESELPTKRQKKKDVRVLKKRLEEIQKEEFNISRGSVITPALYKKAMEMKLI